MSANDNPFAGGQGGYGAQTVQFDGPAGNGAARPASAGNSRSNGISETRVC